jgi:hypothetical protein
MRTRYPLVAITTAVIAIGALALPTSAGRAGTVPPGQEQTIGGIGIRLLEAPVSGRDDPRAHVYIVDHLAPGTVIERRIEVSNTSASTQHVVLYAAAATIDDGSFVGAAGDEPNELSSWTTVRPGEFDISANANLVATVIIDVPTDAPPGEQYGVVWAEARPDAGAGGGVIQVSRVGIRLYVSVGPGGAPAADFTIDHLTARRSSQGQPTVSATVHNTGGRALDMSGTLQLSAGPGGVSAGPFTADPSKTLALGDTQSVSISLDEQLPAGPWEASLTLQSGLTKRTVEATITFPRAGLATQVAVQAHPSDSESTLPAVVVVVGIVVGLLMIAAAILLILRRGRRRRRRRSAERPAWRDPLLPPVRTS